MLLKIFTPDDGSVVAITQCVAIYATDFVWLLAADAQACQGPSSSRLNTMEEVSREKHCCVCNKLCFSELMQELTGQATDCFKLQHANQMLIILLLISTPTKLLHVNRLPSTVHV